MTLFIYLYGVIQLRTISHSCPQRLHTWFTNNIGTTLSFAPAIWITPSPCSFSRVIMTKLPSVPFLHSASKLFWFRSSYNSWQHADNKWLAMFLRTFRRRRPPTRVVSQRTGGTPNCQVCTGLSGVHRTAYAERSTNRLS
jgi:hypothetical protein